MSKVLLNHAYNCQLLELLEVNPVEPRRPKPKRMMRARRPKSVMVPHGHDRSWGIEVASIVAGERAGAGPAGWSVVG